MDRNTIYGLLLIFLLILGYSWWSQPSKEELDKRKHTEDSLVNIRKSVNDSMNTAKVTDSTRGNSSQGVASNDTTEKKTATISRDEFGSFASAAKGTDKDYIIENDLIKLTVSSKGGRISSVQLKKFKTFDSIPVILYEKDSSEFYLNFYSNNRLINTGKMYFEPIFYNKNNEGKDHLVVSGKDSLKFAMRLYADGADSTVDKSKYIEFVYTLYGNDYMTGFAVNFVGTQNAITQNANFIDLYWNASIRRQEKSLKNERMISSIFYKPLKDDVDNLKETKDDEADLKYPMKWVSFKEQFFSATLIAKDQFVSANVKATTNPLIDGGRYLKTMQARVALPYGNTANQSIAMSIYFGPNKYNTLKDYKLDLERQIPLGWSFFLLQWINRYAVIPVFNFLSGFNWNFGIIILILTILLKIVLFPIAYKSYISSAKMKVLKPEVDEIAKKFPKKEQAMDKQKATMALYKKAGANPMSGCVPMLLQFPILIAMFRFFPASIELRQQGFLWATDLSSYDSIVSWTTQIPLLSTFYGNHVSLFALLMAASNLIYTKMNNDMMGSTQSMPGMKTMMYIMPIMFLGFLNSYSSALNYYYFISTMITFGQMFVIRKMVNEEKIHAIIQENKKKIVTKSKFAQRLEDIAKNKGYNPANAKRK